MPDFLRFLEALRFIWPPCRDKMDNVKRPKCTKYKCGDIEAERESLQSKTGEHEMILREDNCSANT